MSSSVEQQQQQQQQTTSSSSSSSEEDKNKKPSIFDQEAINVWKEKGLMKKMGMTSTAEEEQDYEIDIKYNHADIIYEHPKTGGKIFCGDRIASVSPGLLHSFKITHLVNCTHGVGEIKNVFENDPEFKDSFKYYRFPISSFNDHITEDDDTVDAFVDPLYAFIDSAIDNGNNVLIFCVAGAHRAGTTATSCLIYYEKMNPAEAIQKAKMRRDVIDPIHRLPYFLMRVFDAKVLRKKKEVALVVGEKKKNVDE